MYRKIEVENVVERFDGDIRDKVDEYMEMSDFQKNFLASLLLQKRPEKIVEVGVSAGGGTALILETLDQMEQRSEIYSVDVTERWYRSNTYETGFVAKEIQKANKYTSISHQFLLGHSIAHFIETIGSEIDFLILDTSHVLPGELLDFIVCLPFLKDGCIVVLHDVIENHRTGKECEIASRLLFSTVKAENKWCMQEDNSQDFFNSLSELSNIAAFEVSEETRKYASDLFSALACTWNYFLSDVDRREYENIIKAYYNTDQYEWYLEIEKLQRVTYLKKSISGHYKRDERQLRTIWKKCKNVVLYGAGSWGRIYLEYARLFGLPVSCFVISDEEERKFLEIDGIPVYSLRELPFTPDSCVVFLTLDERYWNTAALNLDKIKGGGWSVL